MKVLARIFWLVLLVTTIGFPSLQAQENTIFTESLRHYKSGVELYNKGVYAAASREFQEALELSRPIQEAEARLLRTRATFYKAKCAVALEVPEAERTTLDFIRSNKPDPEFDQALIEVANYFFNERQYDKALEYYAEVPTIGLSKGQREELRFKQGYSYFVNKDFPKAKNYFRDAAQDSKSDYYLPSNYYLGLCHFFEGDYLNAANSFNVVKNDPDYRQEIPYYLTQIYFAQRNFEQVIDYAEPLANDPRVRNRAQIQLLLGQAYFEQVAEMQNQPGANPQQRQQQARAYYQRALENLSQARRSGNKFSEQELYQLGYSQYQTGNYQEAIENLKPLSTVDSPLGQNAMYYLADAYLKLGRKTDALSALGNAKRMGYDPRIQEEARFNYAKLAYELDFSREAVNDLQTFDPRSPYYTQAQKLLGDLLINYKDYGQALQILESQPNLDNNPNLLNTYQKVAVNRGIQLLAEGKTEAARSVFEKARQTPVNPETTAIAQYWLADIANREEDYAESIRLADQFLATAQATQNTLPEESSVPTGMYLQGYNFLKLDDYGQAQKYFQQTVDILNNNRRFISSEDIKEQLLGDATMRLGDSYFKFNQYDQAVRYYDEAIDRRYPGYDYAIFQKAIVEGLRGRKTEEIIALQNLVEQFPKSDYADDALYRLGGTYQEIGKLQQASVPLKKLLRDYRRTSSLVNPTLIRLGLITYNQGNLQGALNYYKQVFGNNPEPEEAQLTLAAMEEIYVRDLGQPNEYFAFLETVPGYKLDNYVRDSINFKSAETRYESGDYGRAIQAYTSYLKNFPNGLNALTAHYHRGESYAVQRQYSEALRDYQFVVDQGPSKYYLKALQKAAIIAYNHELDFQTAFDLYSKLETSTNDENITFDAQLGALRSAYRLGDRQSVYNLASRVNNNPQATMAQQSTADFYLGKLAYDSKDYNNALPALQRVVQNSDNEQTAEARYLIASIYYDQRDLNKAQEMALEANQESSAYPYWVAKSVLLLVEVLADKGDLYNARAALEALLDNYNEDTELVQQAQRRLGEINRQIQQTSPLESSGSNQLNMQNGGN